MDRGEDAASEALSDAPSARACFSRSSWAAALGESWEGRVGFQKGSVASGETCAATPEVSAQESGTRLLAQLRRRSRSSRGEDR